MRRLHVAAAVWIGAAAPGCDLVFSINPGGDAGLGADAAPDAAAEPRWAEVATGQNHTCAIQASDRTLWCWGDNIWGQLGDGSTELRNAPTQIASTRQWRSVAAGQTFTCAIDVESSTAWCWGSNAQGALGTGGTPIIASTPQAVTTGATEVRWQRLVAGRESMCGLDDATGLWCWGNGSFHRLGTGSDQVTLTPTQLEGTGWSDVSLFSFHSCGIRAGQALCWGSNNGGATVPSSGENVFTNPTAVSASLGTAVQIAVGENHSCARFQDDALWCWGADFSGQLGDGATSAAPGPVRVQDAWRSVAANESGTCGLRPDGSLACWGVADRGAFGLPAQTELSLPTSTGAVHWRSFALGGAHSCGLQEDGQLACAGADHRGQLGLGLGGPAPTVRSVMAGVTSIDAKVDHTCATTEGNVLCWGDNRSSQLGLGDAAPRQTPVSVFEVTTPMRLAVGLRHVCTSADNEVRCWGNDVRGSLGNGNSGSSNLPTTVLGLAFARQISACEHTCALDASNNIYCWGANNTAQTGNNSGVDLQVPTATSYQAIKVAAGRNHSCALNGSGGVACWGSNLAGQRGTVSSPDVSSAQIPVVLPELATDIATGQFHSCAVTAGGELWCWGSNDVGQAGVSNGNQPTLPTRVDAPTGLNWSQVAAGDFHTCAIAVDDADMRRLFCFGFNRSGQLGASLQTPFSVMPVEVLHPQGLSWRLAAAGTDHSCAIDTEGMLFCWGGDEFGQLGANNAWRSAFTIVP